MRGSILSRENIGTFGGQMQPMYRMTADGLSELAMSFSGNEARIVRIRFIAAFREVARRLDAAEQSITQMLHEYTKRAAASEAKASLGSHLMHDRRKEKPALKLEELKLKVLSQPRLPQGEDDAVPGPAGAH
jgi:phage regulator Rha-like protein